MLGGLAMLDVPTWAGLGRGRELIAAAELVVLAAPSGVVTLAIDSERLEDPRPFWSLPTSGPPPPQAGGKG